MAVHSHSWTWHSFAYAFQYLGNPFVIEYFWSHEISYFLWVVHEYSHCHLHWGIGIILVSILPSHAMPMFKRSLVIPVYIQFTFYHVGHPWFSFIHHSAFWFTPKHIWSCFVSMMGDSSWLSFDESISCWLQLLIQELDLETKTSTLGLHASMVGYIDFNMITSLNLDWNIEMSVRLQVLYSHLEECTKIPLKSLTWMVISLALVNNLR